MGSMMHKNKCIYKQQMFEKDWKVWTVLLSKRNCSFTLNLPINFYTVNIFNCVVKLNLFHRENSYAALSFFEYDPLRIFPSQTF